MEDTSSVQNLLVSCLSVLAEKIEKCVNLTREDFKASTDLYEFVMYSHDVNHGIMKLIAATPGYVECMQKLGVKTKAELEQLWAKHYGEPGVKEAVEKLLEAEKKYAEFIAEVESELSPNENKLTINDAAKEGEMLPKDHGLIEIPSGQPVTLESCWKGAKFTLFVLLRLFG